jgi:hypothetical protein
LSLCLAMAQALQAALQRTPPRATASPEREQRWLQRVIGCASIQFTQASTAAITRSSWRSASVPAASSASKSEKDTFASNSLSMHSHVAIGDSLEHASRKFARTSAGYPIGATEATGALHPATTNRAATTNCRTYFLGLTSWSFL